MSGKIKVTLEVEPGKTVTLRPFGETLTETSAPVNLDNDTAESVTVPTTYTTDSGGIPDGGVDAGIDF
jgi:hypothetical protein